MVLSNFQCRDILLVWIIIGKEPTVLAADADGVVWTLFIPLICLFFSISLEDGSIQIEILSQRTVKPIPTNQPINMCKDSVNIKLFVFPATLANTATRRV